MVRTQRKHAKAANQAFVATAGADHQVEVLKPTEGGL